MAKPGPAPSPDARKDMVGVRCHKTYKKWVEDFAESQRLTPSVLVDIALVQYAKQVGYDTPPKR